MRLTFRPSPFATLLCLALLVTQGGHANNIAITSSTLASNTGTTVLVQFNLSWENSWRGGGVANWDAAWVFVKYRTSTGVWQHVRVNNTGHTAPAGSQIDPGLRRPTAAYDAVNNPVDGVLIHRSATGSGTFSLTGVQLLWDYSSQGLAYNDLTRVQVYAIEMVYVPQGSFWVGSGGTENGPFTDGAWTSGNTIPFQVASAGGVTIGPGAGNLYGTVSSGSATIGPPAVVPGLYPKGFNAFYCMKYEVTQQGYVDLLNTLTYDQQATRTANLPTSAAGTGAMVTTNTQRNGIDIQTPGVASTTPALYACNLDGNGVYGEATDGSDIASNFMNWGDLAAYLDWSALRPMTELEFEKACRGTMLPVINEFEWGTTDVALSPYTLSDPGANNEGIATNYGTAIGNAVTVQSISTLNGPARVGIFAAHASNTGRITAGATYYGIMEMGGNLSEQLVTIGNAEGRAFAGNHGTGAIDPAGNANQSTWPDATALGAGTRGGSIGHQSSFMRTSARNGAASSGSAVRLYQNGGRGVRTAP